MTNITGKNKQNKKIDTAKKPVHKKSRQPVDKDADFDNKGRPNSPL